MAHPKSIMEDKEMCGILPFLALPDGAHLVRCSVASPSSLNQPLSCRTKRTTPTFTSYPRYQAPSAPNQLPLPPLVPKPCSVSRTPFALSSHHPSPNTTTRSRSCNRQIATSSLLSKEADVTRSTVQKAIVVLASKPLFGLIRDKLGVVTRAFFNQRDFRDHSILTDFCDGLETAIRTQLTESGVYMGVSFLFVLSTG